MDKVLDIAINSDIILDENRVENMPYDLRQYLLVTITIGMERYKCDWRDLTWSIKFNDGQPIIYVKRKPDVNH